MFTKTATTDNKLVIVWVFKDQYPSVPPVGGANAQKRDFLPTLTSLHPELYKIAWHFPPTFWIGDLNSAREEFKIQLCREIRKDCRSWGKRNQNDEKNSSRLSWTLGKIYMYVCTYNIYVCIYMGIYIYTPIKMLKSESILKLVSKAFKWRWPTSPIRHHSVGAHFLLKIPSSLPFA